MYSPDLPLPACPDEKVLARLGDLLNEGRALDAWELAKGFAPLTAWVKAGPMPAFYASRLYAWLGNPRRSDAVDRLARKRYPWSAEVFLRSLSLEGRRRGPLAVLQTIRDPAAHPPMEERHRFFLLNLEGDYWSRWSDFERATACLDEADRLRPGHDRTLVNRAGVLMRADRRREAEIHAREAIRVRPGNVTAPRILAELLRSSDREEEAREVLEAAVGRVQDGEVVLALANWQSEHGNYEEALRLSDGYERLVPLADRKAKQWLAGWRAFRYFLARDYQAALEQAAQAPGCFIAEIADRLRTEHPGRRVRLAVPFVKQDRRTCAPATLAAICRFHGDAAGQVEIAEEICYDGTPDHSERHWAEHRGYVVREFTVTPPTVLALIDLGLPFTLTTVEPASAHLQAVIGYDTKADTLLVREPGWADDAEYRMNLLHDYAFSGPRGMVMAPENRRAALEALELPEAELYDLLHGLQRALHANNRELAVDFLDRMRAQAAGHRLTLLAQRRLAYWDRNVPGQLDGVDGMLRLYPDQPALLYEKLWLLASTAGRQEQMAFARRVQAAGKAPPEVDRLLAELLDDDAREWPAAERAWARAAKRSGFQSATLGGLADFRWSQQRRREAVLYYRLAACVDAMQEGPARSYFSAARWVGLEEGEESLAFLRERVKRYGALAGGPARTLAWALGQLKREGEALEVLEDAVRQRPEEGYLLLDAADVFRDAGRADRAAALVAQAERRVPDGAWLRRMATEAVSRAELMESMGCYRRLLEIEPAAKDVHESLAGLLAGTGDRTAAVAHLEETCRRFPGHASLKALLCHWLGDDLARRGEVLRQLLELNPADGWARRELALDLKKQGRHGEAVREAAEARAVEPKVAASSGILGDVLQAAGRPEEARECLHEALALDVDYGWAISELIAMAPDHVSKQAELRWVLGQLETQVTNGDGLMRWTSEAWVLREPDEVLEVLERVRGIRPDLWQAWSVLSNHLSDMGRRDQALAVVAEAAERFPFLPRVWYDLALIRGRGGDAAGEREALDQVLRLSPRWELAVRRMAEACRNLDDAPSARALLERHSRSNPLDSGVMLDLIRLLRAEGDAVATLAACRRGVALAPLSRDTWSLRAAAAEGDAAELAAVRKEAADLTRSLPQSLAAWECRAAVAATLEGYAEELSVLNEALEQLPGCWDLLDRKAVLLAHSAQYGEALQCCEPGPPGAADGRWRRARAADILHRQGKEAEAILQMEELAREHPDYLWSVQRLVEWHDHRADHAAVVSWTARQTRLSPGEQSGWGYRAGALLALNRSDEAEVALRTAVALDPGYTWAVRQLLGLELKRGDVAAAERTVARVRGRIPIHTIAGIYTSHGLAEQAEVFCRSSVALNVKDAASQEALGEALWKLERNSEAAAAWVAAVRLKPDRLWLVGELHEKAGMAGLLENVASELREWADAAPPEVARLEAYLHFLSKDDDPGAYLGALDGALLRVPDHAAFTDSKAERLTHLRRYTEALEVCGQSDDVMLLRRRAWIEAERGNRGSAIDLMAVALKQDETSEFGLQQICDWLESASRGGEAVPYAEALVKAAPQSAYSFGYLAGALLNCGRKADAEPHLFRALRMSNTYEWASDRLFDLQLEREDFLAAGMTLKMAQEHLPGHATLLKELRWAAGQRHHPEAMHVWQRLAADPAVSSARMESAQGILKKAGWGTKAQASGATGDPWEGLPQTVGPGAYAVWVKDEYLRKNHGVWQRFAGLAEEATRIAAWEAYLKIAGEPAPATPHWDDVRVMKARWAIHRNRDFLKRHENLWAYAAYFYLGNDLYRQGRRWCRDWTTRSGLHSWMLSNVAALQDGKWSLRKGREVREWCLTHLKADHATVRHRIRLAFLAAAEGKPDRALGYLSDVREKDIPPGGTGSDVRLQLNLARLMVRLQNQSNPRATRQTEALAGLERAITASGGILTPGSHGNTLRVFLPFALRRAGWSRFLWRLTLLIPQALGVSQ
ncbi:MAG: tetratricopeptide repeat protein [Verrucomicrobiota bacterium]